MNGVGRLTLKQHSRSTMVKADIHKCISTEFVWSRAHAVSAPAHGWSSHRSFAGCKNMPVSMYLQLSGPINLHAQAAGSLLDEPSLWNFSSAQSPLASHLVAKQTQKKKT